MRCLRILGLAISGVLILVPPVVALRVLPAIAQEVKPLPVAACNQVRAPLEDGLPVGPGFRRM